MMKAVEAVHGVRGIGERSVHWREEVYAKDDDGRI